LGRIRISHWQKNPSSHDLATWLAVYTRTHHEKSVAKRLEELRIEHFLPLYQSRRAWSCNRQVEVSMPLFPNYIFVRVTPRDQARTLGIPGVIMIVRSGPSAGSIDDFEMQQLQRYLSLGSFQPEPAFSEGSLVRITSGPLIGLVGNVVWRANSARVVIAVSSIGQGTSVEVSVDQIAPVLKPRDSCVEREASRSEALLTSE
jgi:transcription antitermination factor NusG